MTRAIRSRPRLLLAVALLICAGLSQFAAAALSQQRTGESFIILQSTTSTQNSGLFDHLLPAFTAATGIEVRVVAVGTGQALKNAQNGDGDVLLVHSRPDEDRFVAAGFGLRRLDVMYNDFVLVGPNGDPAGVRGAPSILAALQKIAAARTPFVSRGDDSGTHKMEQALWRQAGITPPGAGWYRDTGAGMGAALNIAAGIDAYILTDRATWSAFRNKRDLAIVLEGDTALWNPYGVIELNPARNPNIRAREARLFIDWLIGPEGQAAIAAFRVNGEQQFFPLALPDVVAKKGS